MPRRKTPVRAPVSAETARLHKVVVEGTVDELQKVLEGADLDAPGVMGKTALMLAMEGKDLEKARLLVGRGADLEVGDDFNRTALRYVVEGLRGRRGFCGGGAVAVGAGGWGLGKELEEMAEEVRKSLEEMDANPSMPPVISEVQSLAVLKLFLEAGDELSLAPRELKRELLGFETLEELGAGTTGDSGGLKPTLRTGAEDYRAQKSPRDGAGNPERMELAFWKEMVRTGLSAYGARVHFGDTEPFKRPGAVWCDERFGTSLTPLGDGRYVQIGGEHEDFYDPDFNIYNDVIVHDGQGDFQIYGYPREVSNLVVCP